MTREQNIRAILECNFSETKEELIDIAVKNIMALSQEPCEDAISRDAVIRLIRNENSALNDIFVTHSAGEKLSKQINELPSVTPSRHKGHWIWVKDYCKCSECGIGMGHTEYDFCPNCGAEMESEE